MVDFVNYNWSIIEWHTQERERMSLRYAKVCHVCEPEWWFQKPSITATTPAAAPPGQWMTLVWKQTAHITLAAVRGKGKQNVWFVSIFPLLSQKRARVSIFDSKIVFSSFGQGFVWLPMQRGLKDGFQNWFQSEKGSPIQGRKNKSRYTEIWIRSANWNQNRQRGQPKWCLLEG